MPSINKTTTLPSREQTVVTSLPLTPWPRVILIAERKTLRSRRLICTAAAIATFQVRCCAI